MRVLLVPFSIFFATLSYSQTRIDSPSVEWSEVSSNTSKLNNVEALSVDLSAPIYAALVVGMPSIRWQERALRVTNPESNDRSFSVDRRIMAGFLHHPSEGAPEWKLELGRHGDFKSSGHPIGKFNYNLEKPFPKLRPDNSDKLDSWIAMSTIVGSNRRIFTLPELGWCWRELSRGLVLDFVAPTAVRVGYHQDVWTATIGAKQNWIILNDDTKDEGFRVTPQRLLLVEAIRDLPNGFAVTFAGGTEVHDTYAPYVALSFDWTPRP